MYIFVGDEPWADEATRPAAQMGQSALSGAGYIWVSVYSTRGLNLTWSWKGSRGNRTAW